MADHQPHFMGVSQKCYTLSQKWQKNEDVTLQICLILKIRQPIAMQTAGHPEHQIMLLLSATTYIFDHHRAFCISSVSVFFVDPKMLTFLWHYF